MKKIMVSVVLVVTMLAMAGCASKGETKGSDSGKAISLSVFAGSIAENTPTGVGMNEMVTYINEKSNGSLKATAYYDTALGDATSMVQGIQQGTIDIGVSGTAYFSGLVPEVEVFQLPFLFDTLENARAAVDGQAQEIIFTKFEEKGIIGLSLWENGFRELTNNVRPVKNVADLKGIKIRTLPAEVQVATWEALGALPTTIDASELYTALQQGTVSAEENPLHEVVSRKFYEVQKYISITDHVYTPYMMGMSQKSWDKLNDEQKEIVKEAAKVGRDAQRVANEAATKEAKQVLLDNKCEIEENPNKEEFKEIAVKTWSIFTDSYGTELLDIIQNKK